MTYNVFSGTLNPTHFTSREQLAWGLCVTAEQPQIEPVSSRLLIQSPACCTIMPCLSLWIYRIFLVSSDEL